MAVTAMIGGSEAGGPPTGMDWKIEYDDQTREVTAQATGAGLTVVDVTLTATLTRRVSFVAPGQESRAEPGSDFTVVTGSGVQVLESNIPPAQVSRLVSPKGGVGGLSSTATWTR